MTTHDSRLSSALRSRRTGLTLAAFGVLTAAYLAYAGTVSRWLVPPAMQQVPRDVVAAAAPPPPRQGVAMARNWLASQPWAADAERMLHTGPAGETSSPGADAYVYFKEWQPTDRDEAARFKPFAMVWWPAGHPPDAVPYTIEAESAYIRFASKFDLADANPGRVVGGQLEGPTRIRGPDGLVIVGRGFTFSEDAMRIWTASRVQIEYGPHRGTAVGFQADLIPDAAARAQNRLAVAGIRSVRLLRDVVLDLEFSGSDDDDSRVGRPLRDGAAEPGPREKPPRLVAVRSVGSFEYQVERHTGVFEENVRVDSPDPQDPSRFDRLRCHLLTLLFEPRTQTDAASSRGDLQSVAEAAGRTESPSSERERRESPTGEPGPNLDFRRLIADGPQVVLISDKNSLRAFATRVIYDARTRVAQLSDPRPARVFQQTSELHSPEITLEHDEDGQITSVWCAGPGWLKAHDAQTGEVTFDARWQKMLRKYPDPRVPLDVIEFEEQAIVRQPGERVGLAAEFIRMWVERLEMPRTDAPLAGRAASPPKNEADRDDGYRPRRLLALGQVALVSPQWEVETPRLEVRFDDPPQSEATGDDGALPTAARRPRGESAAPSLRTASLTARTVAAAGRGDEAVRVPRGGPLLPPTDGTAQPGQSGTRAPESQVDGPVQVAADLIRVQVLLMPRLDGDAPAGSSTADPPVVRGFEPFVSQVWAEGHVRVQQAHASDEPPLAITGQRAEIHNRSPGDQVLDVFGQPAHIRDRGLHIEGRTIHFDRAANLATVQGAGLLQLPVRQDLEGRQLTEPKLLDVWWNEQMTFDGLAANFYGQVKAALDDSSMRSEEMEVVLTDRVSFRDDETHVGERREDVDIDRVICRDAVEFDSYIYTDSKLTEIRRGRFARFELDQQTGLTEARGPGWIRFWRRGRGKRAAMTPNALVQANRPLEPDASDWEFTRIEFSGTAKGNVRERFTTFHDRVRILYGPVERPLATIELDDLPRDAGWMSSDSLRIIQHEVADAGRRGDDGPAGYIELQATGNAELEGRSFNAQADVISYDESKGLYILRSNGSHTATICHQEQPGAKKSVATAQRIEFIPARNHLKSLRTTGLDGL
ncbi:MAG TPA: hypothetical protein VML55_14395 [Planctomycetaceae bacterium]|nr:hypothetical protein [Planctomycetaceae bacterium]